MSSGTSIARIPLSEPTMGEAEHRYVKMCLRESMVSVKGPFVAAFEALFAEIHDRPTAISTASGTAALHLALVELGVGPGDEVLVPALTFVASANVVRYVGATPVFVDVDPLTYTIDPVDAQTKVGERTRALIAVHLYGHPAAMDELCAIARDRHLALIEDAAEALGARYRGRLCGTIGDLACFSFNGNKLVTSAGGGMVLAGDPERLEHIRHLSLQGREPATVEYLHDEVAFNYALSNLHAAVGLGQLERIEEVLAHRRRLAARYAVALDDTPGLTFCAQAPWAQSNFWLMSVLVDAPRYGRTRQQLMRALGEAGIDSRPFFTPLPDTAAYDTCRDSAIPIARRLHAQGLCLPSSFGLTDADQDRVLAELLPT
jgi:perosamine synthetase